MKIPTYKAGNILIPAISRYLSGSFKKRIPVRIKFVPVRLKDITDYRESPTRFHPYVKDHPTVYDAPYMNQPPYYGIRTDIRYYDYTSGPIIGTKPSELY
jgi:hypothetical protein